ncbi:MAG: DNA-processing protein DprA [Synergistaceae bacterium]|nr:DNA-processing protein DprA [Synergistaceae bacterium]
MYDITTAGLLFNAAGVPCSMFRRLCSEFSPEDAGSHSLWEELGMTSSQKQRLTSLLAKDSWAEQELERTESFGASFITIKDITYPALLLDLDKPPVGLYVKGTVNISLPSVSVVGTRRPSSYGQNTATQLGRALARAGITVTSGGASGVDSAGHRGALAEDGFTVAVFGTGIDVIYPSSNRDLFSRIAERGAIVSEYPFGTTGEGWRFVERNRIIAALSGRTVVVESSETGGAMHTARMCVRLGRELWAVPGRISEETCGGTNRLIAEGAKILVSVEEFVASVAGHREQLSLGLGEPPELSEDAQAVYSLLQRQGGRTADEIVRETGQDFVSVNSALMELEAEALITNAGGRYSALA